MTPYEQISDNIRRGKYETTVHHRDRQAYRADLTFRKKLFRSDLEKAFDVVNHPKAERTFDLVWSEGHSSGWTEILAKYDDFVELIK